MFQRVVIDIAWVLLFCALILIFGSLEIFYRISYTLNVTELSIFREKRLLYPLSFYVKITTYIKRFSASSLPIIGVNMCENYFVPSTKKENHVIRMAMDRHFLSLVKIVL